MTADTEQALEAPGLLRRLGAMLYDTLLLIALAMLLTAALLPFTGGEAVPPGDPWYRLLLLGLSVGFFVGFWTRNGQTLGMLAWRLRVQRSDGKPLTWADAAIRLAAALLSWATLGLGFLWVLVDRERLAWHDRLSKTRLILLPKRSSA